MAELSPSIAAWLGIIEGLTEFIPVSSTGHLILVGHFLGLKGAKAATFEIFIQLGAILAVVFLFWRRFAALINISVSKGPSFSGLTGMAKLTLACLPVFIVGALFGSQVKERLFNPLAVSGALLVGGFLILLLDRPTRRGRTAVLEEVSYWQCLGVGLFQCFSLWPGSSRSACTIIGGLLLGLDRVVAAEFSFLVAVPVMAVATVFDLQQSWPLLSAADLKPFMVGFVTAFLSAILAVRLFVALLQRYTLRPFGIYRVVLALVVLWVLS